MTLIGFVLYNLLQIFFWLLMLRMVLSWVPLFVPNFSPRGLVAVIFEAIYTVTDPPLKLANRYIPPVRLGSIGLDVGFMVVVLGIIVAERLVLAFFF